LPLISVGSLSMAIALIGLRIGAALAELARDLGAPALVQFGSRARALLTPFATT